MFSILCCVRNLKHHEQVDPKHFGQNWLSDMFLEVSKILIYIRVCFCTASQWQNLH